MNSISPSRRALVAAALVPTVLAAFTACGSGTTSAGATSPVSGSSSTTSMAGTEREIGLTSAWVKAADSGMTAAFGMIVNESHEEVTLVKAEFAGAGMVQLHETVKSGDTMVMQERKGGFVIPAEGTFELKPGGNHIMLMDLKSPLRTGTTVELTLVFSNGHTSKTTAEVKPYAGAQETYQPGSSATTSGM
ncbi:MAG TPA: copper chaperone PCu(A)C [Candidatus Lustribacter sp.]|nr:copper chaperone PCu(A)C [Candidatus Lustribacter sp.]